MNHLVIFHGLGGTSQDNWQPSVAEQFRQQGWQVDTLDIPDSNEADLERWVTSVNEQMTLTADSVLVGHSAGCPLILTLLERSVMKVKKAILVAGFVEPIADMVRPLLQDQYDWDKIKQNCGQFCFVNSDNDPYQCDDKQGRIMLDHLGGTQVIMAGEGHFGTSEFNQPYPEFPFLIKLIEH